MFRAMRANFHQNSANLVAWTGAETCHASKTCDVNTSSNRSVESIVAHFLFLCQNYNNPETLSYILKTSYLGVKEVSAKSILVKVFGSVKDLSKRLSDFDCFHGMIVNIYSFFIHVSLLHILMISDNHQNESIYMYM